MRSFKIFGLEIYRASAEPITEPESDEAPERSEPMYRCEPKPKATPGNEGPRLTDEQRTKAAEIYKAMVETDAQLSTFLDSHWRKLRALVNMLRPEEDEDANPAGLLLADVADSFIDGVDGFTTPPLYVQLREYAALVGAGTEAETVGADPVEAHHA